MSTDTNTSVHSRIITAFFDNQTVATQAVNDLIAEGIPRAHISQTGSQNTESANAAPPEKEEKGFWEYLKEIFVPEEERPLYAEGLRRGGYLISVRCDEANYNRVLDILDRDGAVDLDERENEWRTEGWGGLVDPASSGREAATRMSAPATAPDISSSMTDPTAPVSASGATTAPALAAGSTEQTPVDRRAPSSVATGQDTVVPVYEENLRVGKRDIGRGQVRVRSYVVETPVNEQVRLRDENVEIQRRPVDRAVTAGDAPFQNRTIEAEEHAEEPVISKEARVKEEITLRKTAEDRVQNVADKVRHTEVEVQDDRSTGLAQRNATLSTLIDPSLIVEKMDVISQDGQKIGTVDHLDGPDRIKLAKSTSPDGMHHIVPLSWIDHVDQHVHLKKTTAEVKAGW